MAGVYISYPFCSQKCTFCNFASGVFAAEDKARYQGALLEELKACAWPWSPETVYLGGGTPSLLPVAELREIVDVVPSEKLREVTIECAPGTVKPGWRQLGINRVSLGVQSFVAAELTRTGRSHTAAQVQREVAELRSSGITNINVDLIAGLPGQTRESWNISLDWIGRLQPPHVSVYIFEVDEDSRLGKESLLGGVRYGANALPSDDLTAELYQTAVRRLAGMGIARYEISNFALPGFESLHNLKYWELAPYLGFGLDAHSFDGRERWSNPDDLQSYLDGVRQVDRAASHPDEEHFFVGLRLTRGIQPTVGERELFAEPIARWTAEGLLEEHGGWLRLSDRGVMVSNEVLQEFVLV